MQDPQLDYQRIRQEKNRVSQQRHRVRKKLKGVELQQTIEALASSLQEVEQEKQLVAVELQALQAAVDTGRSQQSQILRGIPQADDVDFVPAVSWAGFNPAGHGRLVLKAVCSPPRKLNFEDSLKLTVADLTEFKKEVSFRCGELLLEAPEASQGSAVNVRLREVIRECCGFSCYIACWRPDLQHRTQAINYQTGRPCQTRNASFYQQLLGKLDLDERQKYLLSLVYKDYSQKLRGILNEREQLKQALLEVPEDTIWGQQEQIRLLQKNVVAEHVATLVVWSLISQNKAAYAPDLLIALMFSDVQMAKFLLASWPDGIDPIALLSCIFQEATDPEAVEGHQCASQDLTCDAELPSEAMSPTYIFKQLQEALLSIPSQLREAEFLQAFRGLAV